MKSNTKPRIGIIGAGRLGTAIARQALAADYHVTIANSKKIRHRYPGNSIE